MIKLNSIFDSQVLTYGDLKIEVLPQNYILENNPELPLDYPELGDVILIANCFTFENGLYVVQAVLSFRPKYYLENGALAFLYRLVKIDSEEVFNIDSKNFIGCCSIVGKGKIEG